MSRTRAALKPAAAKASGSNRLPGAKTPDSSSFQPACAKDLYISHSVSEADEEGGTRDVEIARLSSEHFGRQGTHT